MLEILDLKILIKPYLEIFAQLHKNRTCSLEIRLKGSFTFSVSVQRYLGVIFFFVLAFGGMSPKQEACLQML